MKVDMIESGLPGCSFCSSIESAARVTNASFLRAAKALLFSSRSYCSRARSVAETNAASAGIIATPLVASASAATPHGASAAKMVAATAENMAVTTARF